MAKNNKNKWKPSDWIKFIKALSVLAFMTFLIVAVIKDKKVKITKGDSTIEFEVGILESVQNALSSVIAQKDIKDALINAK